MKHNLFTHILHSSLLMALMAALGACDSTIYDEEGDCEPVHIIRFRYDMNMKFVDAFPAEVPSVNLYVFDTEGNLVLTESREVVRSSDNDFIIELRGIAPGHYDLLAWCGVKDNNHFLVNPESKSPSVMQNHTCRISREEDQSTGKGNINEDIGRMYHGRLDNVDMTADEGRYEHTVRLTKDTNVIRVVLQHLSGAKIDKDDFVITITDANGFYDPSNQLLADMGLTYHPWIVNGGIASFLPGDEPAGGSRAQTSASAVVAELTVGRLMAERHKDVSLTVTNSHTGKLILSIPLIDYLLLVKGYYYTEDGRTPMGDQEYLDRQDEYPMTFFLDDKDEWIKTIIYINSWRVVLNDSSLH